jgi:uncharacterized membrane protein (UPF0127 family)
MPHRLTRTLSIFNAYRLVQAIWLALAVAMITLLVACGGIDEHRLVLHTAKGDSWFGVEIADSPAERSLGLMYRQSLAADAGMLFDYQSEQLVSFWMDNTEIPLDMVFIGADGVVKAIHENAKPKDRTSIPSGVPVRFVLEIPGGRSAEIGLKPGDRMEHPRVEAGD